MDLADPFDSVYTLAALLVLAWHAVPTKSGYGQADCLWDQKFFELGFRRWLQAQSPSVDDSTMILFHVGLIVLHTHMANIHCAVREFSVGKSSLPIPSSAISRWRESDDCEIASLHARRVIDIGTRIVARTRLAQSTQSAPTASQLGEATRDEAPHVAICVYLAVITLWVAEVADGPGHLCSARVVLDEGCRILQRLNVRIAQGLGNILRRLEEKCH